MKSAPSHSRRQLTIVALLGLGGIHFYSIASGTAIDTIDIAATHPAVPAADSTLHGVRDAAVVRPAAADSTLGLRVIARSHAADSTLRGMRDTVTVLPPVRVDGARGLAGGRTTATTNRVERAQAIRFLPATVSDALAMVPGVDLIRTGPWSTRLSLRGLTGDRVLLMVDGVQMNSVRGHGAQSSLVALDRVSAVEVLPGAASGQFGSDALAGVINIVTHRSLFGDTPRLTAALDARGSEPGGSYTQNARARFTSPRGGLEVSGGLGNLDHLHTPDGSVANSGDREEDFAVRGGTKWGPATFDVEHSHHAARDVGLPGFTGGAVVAGSYPLEGRDAQRAEFAVKGNGALPGLRLLGVHQVMRTYFDETSIDSTWIRGHFTSTLTRAASDRVTTHVSSLEPSLRFGGPGNVQVFGEWRREAAGGPLTADMVTRDRDGTVTNTATSEGVSVPPARRTAWAAGLAASHTLSNIKLEADARYDVLRSSADSTVNIHTSILDVTDRRVSAEGGVSRAFGAAEPYAHVGTGFRAPNLDERYFNNTIHGGLRLFGNPALRSERSRSYEAGLRSSAAAPEWLTTARLSAYRSDVDDLISFKYIGQLGLVPRFQYFNVQRARIEGLEAAGAVRSNGWELGISGTLPRGRDLTTGDKLEDMGTARASIELIAPVRRLLPYGSISTRVRWNDAVRGVSQVLRQPAFSTTSVQADCVIGGVRAAFAVNNLWNTRYREPMSFIAEPGRTFALSLYRDFSGRWPFNRES